MAWNHATALKRINKLCNEVPDFDIQRFDDYLPEYGVWKALAEARNQPTTPPLFNLPKGKAVVVNTVQIYIKIANYDEYRLEEGLETEASHERAMRLLHLYYSAADRVIEESAAQRVDFHNGRVHAVILEQGANSVTRETIGYAFAFIEDFKQVADIANRRLAKSRFSAQFRVGVDVGTCVAINNGSGLEQEPLFLGSAANYAAKLAQGEKAGVYVSDNVRNILDLPKLGISEKFVGFSDAELAVNTARQNSIGKTVFGVQNRQRFIDDLVKNWEAEIKKTGSIGFTDPSFSFFYEPPPLSELDYKDLMPSHSIRMPLVSIFADLSGYTNYIDQAILSGNISDAVRALYVIRAEFQNVVEDDFGGRKVRFIGDCIHALIAEGSSTQTNSSKTVVSAIKCAGGLHSSFSLCKSELRGLDTLGLAVGLEFGNTPISRIGIRGERSIRVASSIATSRSEQMQQDCEHNGVKLGMVALSHAPVALEDLLVDGYCAELDYGDVTLCLPSKVETVSAPVYVARQVPKAQPEPRAHFRST